MNDPKTPAVIASPIFVTDKPKTDSAADKPADAITWKDFAACALVLIAAMFVLSLFLHRP